MPLITVTGKDDLGFSPKFGPIIKGQQYDIEEEDFASELFDRNQESEVRSQNKTKSNDSES